MPSGNGSALEDWPEDDDLYQNSFAGPSQTSTTTFTSAIRPSETRVVTRQALRRRLSDSVGKRARKDHDAWEEGGERGGAHVRSRTESAVVGGSGGGSGSGSRMKDHPLDRRLRGSKSNASMVSLNDTRPRLKRLVGHLGFDGSEEDSKGSDTDDEQLDVAAPTMQRVVIVHEVSPIDSLAGVALKYGVTLAELRRANQMWASDSIHFRKVLYIPLDKTQKSKQLNLALVDLDSGPSSTPSSEHGPILETSISGQDGDGGGGQHNLTIKRVPASQLSYFPPSSKSSALDASSASSAYTMPRTLSNLPRRPAVSFDLFFPSNAPQLSQLDKPNGASTPASSVAQPIRSQITSLFNALPIAPSTRDTLMARLSLDSSASTPTQGSDEQEHEMGDVSGSSLKSSHLHDSATGHKLVFPDQHLRNAGTSGIDILDKEFELQALFHPTTPPSSHHRLSAATQTQTSAVATSPSKRRVSVAGAPYASPERVAERSEVVRTAQLQPSAGMQLPLRARRSKDGNT